MKKPRFKESQIFQVLKEAEAGVPVPELCRKHGMSNASFYKGRAKYGGMDVSNMKRMKELEQENARLKKMYAEEKLKAEIVSEALEKNGEAISTQGDGQTGDKEQGCVDPPGLPGVRYFRDLFSLPGEAQ
jgi:putative transposase